MFGAIGFWRLGLLCGQTGLTQVHLLLTQHLLAVAAMFFWQCSIFRRSSRSNWSTVLDLKLTCRRVMHELRFRGQSCGSELKLKIPLPAHSCQS